ncbi:MAG: hypothetical protein ACJ8BC_13640, partial [Gemmatimonadales bacterium]
MRILLLSLLATAQLAAQQAAPSTTDSSEQGDRSPFRRLELPAPNRLRTGAGAPGQDYWQQRVDYIIRASLDTAAQTVTGEERITYSNRSPDTLRYLWFQLDQNLFNSSSRGSLIFDQSSRFGTAGAQGGVTLTKVQLAALAKSSSRPGRPATALKYLVNGTMMRVDLPRPLPPGSREVL